jgi:type IV secretory pathway VirB2 component (pilin)
MNVFKRLYLQTALTLACSGVPGFAFAQAGPFGGTAQLPAIFLTIGGPFATVALMASAILAGMDQISWRWFWGIVLCIVLFFGAPQIVTWIRSIFGV